MSNNLKYTAESVQTLEGLEPFRKSPGMYIGSTTEYGLHHIVKEIINNAVDEYMNGSCDTITVTLGKDNVICIEDNGRGFPHGMLDDTFSILGGCFGKEHTGGKFNNEGESGYNTSGGMHGIGCKCAAALGILTKAESYRDGIYERVIFEQGKMLEQLTDGTCDKNIHGTVVTWKPDPEIFGDLKFDLKKIEVELCQEYSFLNSGLKFIIRDLRQSTETYRQEYYSSEGIADYLDYLNNGKQYLTQPIILKEAEGRYSVELGIAYNDSYSSTVKLYTNSIPQSKGTHLTGFKTAWTTAINAFAKENGYLKTGDNNLTGEDLAEGQLLVINFKMINPVFEGQIKDNLTSSEGRTYVQKLVSSSIKNYLELDKLGIKSIIDKAINARKAREAARKARDAARQTKITKQEKGLKAKMMLSDKFIDCRSKNPKDRVLLLVEGLSAGGSALEARNPITDCIYMLRGKVLSTLKCDVNKILANQELSDIIKVIGAGFGSSFDISSMNFDKIVITADQDSDGSAIELLLITFFYTYMRPLVEAGKLYRAVTPLYIITYNNKKDYCYSERELAEWKENHGGVKYELSHCKGLGEVSASVLKEICFEKQRYKRITLSDIEETTKLLNILEGPSADLRKQYIYDNAERLGFNFM